MQITVHDSSMPKLDRKAKHWFCSYEKCWISDLIIVKCKCMHYLHLIEVSTSVVYTYYRQKITFLSTFNIRNFICWGNFYFYWSNILRHLRHLFVTTVCRVEINNSWHLSLKIHLLLILVSISVRVLIYSLNSHEKTRKVKGTFWWINICVCEIYHTWLIHSHQCQCSKNIMTFLHNK